MLGTLMHGLAQGSYPVGMVVVAKGDRGESYLVHRLLPETWTVPPCPEGSRVGCQGLGPHASVLLSNSINKCVLSTNYLSGAGLGVAGRGCKGE